MSQIEACTAALVEAGLAIGFEPLDSPAGTRAEVGQLKAAPDISVSLVEEAGSAPFDIPFVSKICAEAEPRIQKAAQAFDEAVPTEAIASWRPELAFFGAQEWSVHFVEAPNAGELGVLVEFDGDLLMAVETLDDAEFAD